MIRMFTLAATYRNLFRYSHPYATRFTFYAAVLGTAALIVARASSLA
jgi:hypothetical protein